MKDGEPETWVEKIVYWVGRAKIWQSRLSTYTNIITFFGMLYLVVRDNPYLSGLQVVGLLILGIPFILYLDVKHIFPASQKYSTRKNPEMMEIKKIVKRIDEKMDGKS